MAKLNKVFLIGNLCRDPELRYAPSGTAIVSFSIAMNRTWEKDGEKKEEVCYVEISMFGKRAEVINEYFHKGDPIFIEGRLQFQQWETKDGQKRSALRVVATDFQFIGGKGDSKKPEEDIHSVPQEGDPDVDEEEVPF